MLANSKDPLLDTAPKEFQRNEPTKRSSKLDSFPLLMNLCKKVCIFKIAHYVWFIELNFQLIFMWTIYQQILKTVFYIWLITTWLL